MGLRLMVGSLAMLALILTGCGGGGGKKTPDPGPDPNPDPAVQVNLNLTSTLTHLTNRVVLLDYTASAQPASDFTLPMVSYVLNVQYSTDAGQHWASATELRSTGSGPQRGLSQPLAIGGVVPIKFFWDAETDLRSAGSEDGPLSVTIRVVGTQSGGPGTGLSARIAFEVDWANTSGCVHTAPSIQVERELDLTEAVPISRQLVAAGGDLPLTWTVQPALANGLILDPSGALNGSPSASNADYFLTVKDTCGDRSDSQWVRIRVLPPACSPLQFNTDANMLEGVVGDDYLMNLPALLSKQGTGALTWSLGNGVRLPAGVTLDSTGKLVGKPGAGSAGVYAVTLIVKDSCDSRQTETALYVLKVKN